MMMTAQLCKDTMTYWIFHFKWMNFVYVNYIPVRLLKKVKVTKNV